MQINTDAGVSGIGDPGVRTSLVGRGCDARQDRLLSGVREKTSIPISGAEHEYTRWGFKRFMDAEAVDIIQPDLNWAGGLSEVLKIAAMATAYDLITIAHQGVSPVGMAWSAAQSPIHTPYVEMLLKHAALGYWFDANGGPILNNGMLTVSDEPGFGYVIDEDKVESETELRF